jgi:hypothetical protein
MARLARALNIDALADVDFRQLAKKVRAQGRGRDTVLAHITPAEAKLLKARGGRGSINPKTGLPEFEDDFDFGGDFGGGGDFYSAPTYEYYDEPVQDASGGGDAGEGTNTTQGDVGADAALQQGQQPTEAAAPVASNVTQEGLTAFTDPGNLGLPGPGADPNSAEATAARAEFDTKYPDVASIANANEAAAARAEAAGPESSGGISSLLNSLGLGGTGLSRLLGNTSNADLARLLAAGGAGVVARNNSNQALNDAKNAADQIRDIAKDPVIAADKAKEDLNKVGNTGIAAANTAQTGIANLAADQQKRVDTAVAQIQQLADTANLRAVDVQKGLATIATNTGLRAADIQAQYNKIANPYQTQGAELAQMGLSGGLTPAMAQAFQAAEARLAQQGIGRGGVAAAQSANQLEALRAQLLGDEYKQGLATQQIGDQYAQRGIDASTAQANLGDQLSNQALLAGLNQYNYANTLGSSAVTTGLAGSAAANALAASGIQTGLTGAREANVLSVQGITAALQAAGIRDQNLIKAIEVQLKGNETARNAMQGLFTQIGGFLGGGTGGGNNTITVRAGT